MKEESKATKKRRILKVSLKLLLFAAVSVCLFFQLKTIKWEEFEHFHIENWWALIVAVVLVFVNQGIEFLKWKRFAQHIIKDQSVIRRSFFAGLASGFLSPNGWGNVLGRMLYFRRRDGMTIILSTALGNLSQLLPTVFFGAVAFMSGTMQFSRSMELSFFILCSLLFIVLMFLYWFADRFLSSTRRRSKVIRHFLLMLERFGYLRLELLLLSSFRFLVFTAQFVLLFVAVGYVNIIELALSVWLIYAFTSFIPSLWSGKILIRESAALFVFSGSIVQPSSIIIVCLLIWTINIALPALFGSFVWIPINRKQK